MQSTGDCCSSYLLLLLLLLFWLIQNFGQKCGPHRWKYTKNFDAKICGLHGRGVLCSFRSNPMYGFRKNAKKLSKISIRAKWGHFQVAAIPKRYIGTKIGNIQNVRLGPKIIDIIWFWTYSTRWRYKQGQCVLVYAFFQTLLLRHTFTHRLHLNFKTQAFLSSLQGYRSHRDGIHSFP